MNIVEQLRRDEGEVLKVYRDSLGILTAGVGHNLEAHPDPDQAWHEGDPISKEQSEAWLKEDIRIAQIALQRTFPWTFEIGEIRRAVFVNMTFNLGIGRLSKFRQFLAAASAGNFVLASVYMLQSLWAKQVGPRAQRLSQQLRYNIWV